MNRSAEQQPGVRAFAADLKSAIFSLFLLDATAVGRFASWPGETPALSSD
jgi:hypothetical protein